MLYMYLCMYELIIDQWEHTVRTKTALCSTECTVLNCTCTVLVLYLTVLVLYLTVLRMNEIIKNTTLISSLFYSTTNSKKNSRYSHKLYRRTPRSRCSLTEKHGLNHCLVWNYSVWMNWVEFISFRKIHCALLNMWKHMYIYIYE